LRLRDSPRNPQRRHRCRKAADREVGSSLLQFGEPEPLRQALADFIEHVHGRRLPPAELFDQRHALRQLRPARFELLHLREDRSQLLRLRLRAGEVLIELGGPLPERQEPPANAQDRGNQDQAGSDRHAMCGGNQRAACLLRTTAFDRQ
jgi:hypothetical protein